MINREILKDDGDVEQPAINIRDYADGVIGITQGKDEVLVNHGTLPELIKVLRHYQGK